MLSRQGCAAHAAERHQRPAGRRRRWRFGGYIDLRRVHDHLARVEPTSGTALPSLEDAEKSSMPIATFTAIA